MMTKLFFPTIDIAHRSIPIPSPHILLGNYSSWGGTSIIEDRGQNWWHAKIIGGFGLEKVISFIIKFLNPCYASLIHNYHQITDQRGLRGMWLR